MPFNGLTVLGTAMRVAGGGWRVAGTSEAASARESGQPATRNPQPAAVCSTADVLADDSLAYLARGLAEEVVGAAARLGHRLPADLVDLNMKRTREMGAYRPSSLLDYLAGRPLELEPIWGETTRRAFNAGAPIGRLETIYHLLRSLPPAEPNRPANLSRRSRRILPLPPPSPRWATTSTAR